MDSGMEGGLHGLLRGVEVKQLLGLEFGRSALTGVGLMRRDGLVALNTFQKHPLTTKKAAENSNRISFFCEKINL